MKQIIILGSKPYAIIPGGDKIYSANGATFGNKIKKSDFTDHINVAHVYTLEKGLNWIKSNLIHKQKLKAIINSGFERLVLFTSANDASSTLRVKNYLTHTNIKEIEVLTFYDQRILVRKIGKCGYPIIGKYFFLQMPKNIINDGLKIVKALFSWKFGKGYIDVYSRYRPSTGILALLVAINENGPSAKYVLCGIGTKNRNQFLVQNRIFFNNIKINDASTEHSDADIYLLSNLRHHFDLLTTEKELFHILPEYETEF